MAKAVFTTKLEPGYDDLPEQRYHFPSTYLRAVERAVGDLIVCYEPRRSSPDLGSRGGRWAYFAVARVDEITLDLVQPNHFYATISDFLEFDRPVPFRKGETFFESFLRRQDGGTSKGAFGRAVRLIPEDEFEAILSAGFTQDEAVQDATLRPPGFDYVRPIIQSVVSRPFRDQAFKRHVRGAYDNRCAMTGLRIINGGGRPEVQAAHIKPVAMSGPDSVRNGIALSSTVHWMFAEGSSRSVTTSAFWSQAMACPRRRPACRIPTARFVCRRTTCYGRTVNSWIIIAGCLQGLTLLKRFDFHTSERPSSGRGRRVGKARAVSRMCRGA